MTVQLSHEWKRYYTRAFWLQDYEMPIILRAMEHSKGQLAEVLCIPNERKTETWYRQDEFEGYLHNLGQDFLQPQFSLPEHQRLFQHTKSILEQTVKSVAKRSSNAQPKDIIALYQELEKAYKNFLPFIWYPWGITFFLEQWCTERLQERYSNWDEMIEIIGRTPQRIQMEKMIDAVCEWHTGTRDSKTLKHIMQCYGYLGGYSARDSMWSEKEILKRAEPLTLCDERLKSNAANAKQITEAYNTLHRQLSADDPKLCQAVDVIHEYIWLRTERIDVYKWSRMNVQPLYRRIEQLFSWPFGVSVHLTVQELMSHLEGEEAITTEELVRREREGYVVHITAKRTTVIVDKKEREKFIQQQLGVKNYAVDQCVGQTACRGVVSGCIRVILHTADIHQFQEGEILVSNMTHPDYMPAIRKAAGIITDEGGIVCHAAVIARELGIPCVIGTGDATKIFKTGDRVMVDANTGIAKKLNTT